MKFYAVSLSARASDWMTDCLDVKLRRRIGRAIDALPSNPRPNGCVKLSGEDRVWRVRVGDYRILYEIRDERLVVLVIRIANRREACR
ncbi:MAG: type II toxin-antitoxin system RelE/ParE family toxin [Opitutaceae bacterium]